MASSINNALSRLASLLAVALVGVLASGALAASLGRVARVAAGLSVFGAVSAACSSDVRTDRRGPPRGRMKPDARVGSAAGSAAGRAKSV